MAKDPVCGMDVDEGSELKSVHKGVTYYFCSEGCKKAFDKNPARYLKKETGGQHGGQHH